MNIELKTDHAILGHVNSWLDGGFQDEPPTKEEIAALANDAQAAHTWRTLFGDASNKLAAHAPQQWIPVSERAPEIGQEVLVHIAGDILTTRLERVWCDGGRRPFEAETDQTRFATHWMPLPAPPVPDTPGQPATSGFADCPNNREWFEKTYSAPRVPQGEEKQP